MKNIYNLLNNDNCYKDEFYSYINYIDVDYPKAFSTKELYSDYAESLEESLNSLKLSKVHLYDNKKLPQALKLDERLHLIELDNVKFQNSISSLCVFLKKFYYTPLLKFEGINITNQGNNIFLFHLTNSFLNLEWIKNLYLIVKVCSSKPSSNGAALFDIKSDTHKFYKDTINYIEHAHIELNLYKDITIHKIESTLKHELKHVYTHFANKLKTQNPEITFRAKHFFGDGKKLDMTERCLEQPDLYLRVYNTSIILNTINYALYAINFDEMRSKLENANAEFKEAYSDIWIDEFRKKTIESKLIYYFKKSNTNKTYLWIRDFSIYAKKSRNIKLLIKQYFLGNEFNKSFGFICNDSIQFLDYLHQKSTEFIKKSGTVFANYTNDISQKLNYVEKTIKFNFFYNACNKSFKNVSKIGNKTNKLHKFLDNFYKVKYPKIHMIIDDNIQTIINKFDELYNLKIPTKLYF